VLESKPFNDKILKTVTAIEKICNERKILCLHDLPPLSPKLRYLARSGPPFVIRSLLIGWGCPGLKMVDLSERENGLWGRER